MEDENNKLVPANPDDGNNVRASWNYGLDKITVKMAEAGYSPELREEMTALFRWCIDPKHPVRREEAARRLECSGNLIYQIHSGIYKNPTAEFLAKVRNFLAAERKRFDSIETDFVMMPTTKRILTGCQLARESKSPVWIVGPSHIGKTRGLLYDQAKNNHGKTIYSRMMAASGLGGMVRRMAESANISDRSNTASLIERIKRATTPDMTWLLDEVHLLSNTYRKESFFACMEVIREIYDETGAGFVLAFTLLHEINAARQKELQQFWRRGVHKIFLPTMPTKGDLAAILEHHGLNFPDKEFEVTVGRVTDSPYEVLRQLAKTEGLKCITERLRYANKLAAKGNGKLSWNNFMEAHLRIAKQAEQEGEWI